MNFTFRRVSELSLPFHTLSMEKKQKRFCEYQLPQEIIHHIQSFMNGRKAAQTALLSKQWHAAWSTRPNLSFNQYHFSKNEFVEFTKKTMQRYEDRSLNIQSFSLGIKRCIDFPLAAKLTVKAIKLGATEIEIQFLTFTRKLFVLADEVFQSQTLTRLSINGGCTLGLQRRRKKKEVITTPSNLKSLRLSSIYDVDENIIRDLFLRFPLIEELTLKDLQPCFDLGALIKLHKLKFLQLDCIGERLFSSELWPKFTCLKELVLIADWFSNYEDPIRICSTSLERITICAYRSRSVNVELDVPNVRMFQFESNHMPRIELKTAPREWETHIRMTFRLYDNDTIASWFKSLKQLVKMLGRSRLSLCMNLRLGKGDGDGYVEHGLDVPALENLTIKGSYTMSPSFLEALLWSCRPNFINIARRCVFDIEKVNVEGFPKLQSLPWKALLDAWRGDGEFIRFQLK